MFVVSWLSAHEISVTAFTSSLLQGVYKVAVQVLTIVASSGASPGKSYFQTLQVFWQNSFSCSSRSSGSHFLLAVDWWPVLTLRGHLGLALDHVGFLHPTTYPSDPARKGLLQDRRCNCMHHNHKGDILSPLPYFTEKQVTDPTHNTREGNNIKT